MEPQQKPLGRTGLTLSMLGFGGTALGNMYTAMSEREAIATLDAAYAAGLRYFDTAPLYGHGLSELRLGGGLRRFADPGVVVSTKVGWRLKPTFGEPTDAGLFQDITAFSPLQRLQLRRRDALVRGQPEPPGRRARRHPADPRCRSPQSGGSRCPKYSGRRWTGAYKALLSLREQGLVKAIGCGLNEWEACEAVRRSRRLRLFPAGRPLHAAATGIAANPFFRCASNAASASSWAAPTTPASSPAARSRTHGSTTRPPRCSAGKSRSYRSGVRTPWRCRSKLLRCSFLCIIPALPASFPACAVPAEIADNLRMLHARFPADLWRELKTRSLMDGDAPTP